VSAKTILSQCIPLVEPLGYDVVDVETSPKGKVLRVFVDRLDRQPVTLDDCAAVSNAIQDPLDAAGVEYERLEVSSPGVDRALTRPAHFARFVGEQVSLRLASAVAGRVIVEGRLIASNEMGCEVEVGGAKHAIEFANVKKARLIAELNWNGLEKSE
jgi:ribosome maturation factor RimP